MRIFITSLLMLFALHSFSQSDVGTVKYKIEYRDSNDTYLKVYFMDSTSGEFFPEEFDLIITDLNHSPRTSLFNKRKLDVNKIPSPILIKPSTYSLKVLNSEINRFEIKEGKVNHLYVYFRKGELQFRYRAALATPVEYEAKIVKRYSHEQPFIQKCIDKVAYDPGNYYIEINTIPPYKALIDLSYNDLYEIQIGKPGYLVIKASDKTSDIKILQSLGDVWSKIEKVDLNNSSIFPLKLLPYQYKIEWKQKGKPKEMYIKIKSDETTEINCF